MKNSLLESMPLEELWRLHETIASKLANKLAAETTRLEKELLKLGAVTDQQKPDPARRPYPKVLPKYRNPTKPAETWSGRGKQPRWIRAQLEIGRRLTDFLIDRPRAK